MKSLLIVDSDLEICEILSTLLSEFGHVLIAKDGAEAWEIFQRQPVHFVVSEIDLPVKSGIDLLRDIRNKPSSVPFCIVSDHIRHDYTEIMSLGVTAYLLKSLDNFEKMVSLIRQHFENSAHI